MTKSYLLIFPQGGSNFSEVRSLTIPALIEIQSAIKRKGLPATFNVPETPVFSAFCDILFLTFVSNKRVTFQIDCKTAYKPLLKSGFVPPPQAYSGTPIKNHKIFGAVSRFTLI